MKRILVGLDASERAQVVLRSAIALAKLSGAKLFLLRAVTMPVDLPSSLLSVSPETALTTLHDEAKRQLDALAHTVPAELLGGSQVRVGGSPWQAICDAGREENASMIVIGSHSYGGLDRLLGTTAAKVVNHADRSVLVLRAPELLEMAT
jgi:nucleotide-binding universal stress UspA family protein